MLAIRDKPPATLMMPHLTLKLFGTPEVMVDGELQTSFHSSKIRALLYYLAVTGRSHSRPALAALFWGNLPETNAASNLRKALTNLRKVAGDHLVISREAVAFIASENQTVDSNQFEALLQADGPTLADLQAAVELYRGEFLEGVLVRDSAGSASSGYSEFETWLFQQRYRLRNLLQTALIDLAEGYADADSPEKGVAVARQLVELEPLDEESQRLLMLMYAQAGQRERAKAQYAQIEALLSAELQTAPAAATTRLHEKIMQGEFAPTDHGLGETTKGYGNQLSILRDKVRRYWIDGVLQQAQQPTVPIDLNWVHKRELIERPWADFERSGTTRTRGTSANLLQTFDDSERALLILGSAGAGKTITLLKLANELIYESADKAEQPVPIVLLLSSWANRKRPLEQWVLDELSSRYQIPRRMGKRWLADNRLLLLLDGLDEVATADQDACIQAINQFRATHGLIGVALCCRHGVLEAQTVCLKMQDAIMLQPLTALQVQRYLVQVAPRFQHLQQQIDTQSWLRDMAQSPLLLNLLTVAWEEESADSIGSGQAKPLTQDELFERFIEQQFGCVPREETGQAPVPLLSWLARKMRQHNQAAFYIEGLQPSWLEQRRSRLLYLFLTRLCIIGFLGVAMALLYRAGTLDQPQFRLQLFADAGAWLPLSRSWQETVGFMLVAQAHWVLAAIIDGWWYERRYGQANEAQFSRRGALLLIAIHAAASLGYIVSAALPYGAATLSFFSGVLLVYFIVIALGYWNHAQSYQTDIKAAASLGWSWRGAGYGALFGLALGAVFTWLGNPAQYIMLVVPAAAATGGLRRIGLERSFKPNQGICATARNTLIGGVTQALIPALLFGWTSSLEFTLITSLVAGGIGAMLFGGATLVKHGILRLLLHLESDLPLDLAAFLDSISNISLLRRIGGGYIFFHRLLQDHFAMRQQAREGVNSLPSHDSG